jgi:NIMA (never in mitosis gene a)-related kinase
MRPSAAQLLKHEQIKFALKVSETEKRYVVSSGLPFLCVDQLAGSRLDTLKCRELELNEREKRMTEKIQHMDAQIHLLQTQLHDCQSELHDAQLQIQFHPGAIQEAVNNREEELRALVLRREEEVGRSIQMREEEIMNALRQREGELLDAWSKREEEMREILGRELEAREQTFQLRDNDLQRWELAVAMEEERLAATKVLLKEKSIKMGETGLYRHQKARSLFIRPFLKLHQRRRYPQGGPFISPKLPSRA